MTASKQAEVAIVGVGSTGFTTKNSDQSSGAYAYRAAIAAIADAGLGKEDIDGVVSSLQLAPGPAAKEMVGALGLPRVTYYGDSGEVMISALAEARNAIAGGNCETVLVFHPNYRSPYQSKKAAADPFRSSKRADDPVDSVRESAAYAAWASRLFAESPGLTREHLGRIAINSRTNAGRNPLAVFRSPMTMEDYLGARMVRDPLCLFDMDVPVDGADAFVVTSPERARELARPPIVVRAAVLGMTEYTDEDRLPSLERHAHDVVAEELADRAPIDWAEHDVAFLYDGFTNITLSWIEKLGWAAPGEVGAFVDEHWSEAEQRLLLGGRVPVNPHGGSLSEGATQGAGHLREAVVQLRGEAGERQVEGARSAILAIGGFFYNAQGAVLERADGGAS